MSPTTTTTTTATTTATRRTTKKENNDGAKRVQKWMNDMDWQGKIGQMSQIDVTMLLNEDKSALRQDLVEHYIGTKGIGSILNVVSWWTNGEQNTHGWTKVDYLQASRQLQEMAKKYNRPPVIWGLDSVHGANYLYGSVITPQPINLAATFNRTVSNQAGLWASQDTQQAGILWLFSPLLGLAWEPLWSRVYETFGEDPFVVGEMALSMTRGIQKRQEKRNTNTTIKQQSILQAAACAKHYVGYSIPHDGHDRSPTWITKRHLMEYFIRPWQKVLKEVDTVMESYTDADGGVPNVANRFTLDTLLRHRLQYENGVLVTDYSEIYNLADWHFVAENRQAATLQSIRDGTVDMSMIPLDVDDYMTSLLEEAKRKHPSFQNRINTSVERVLQLKENLGMFDDPLLDSITIDDDDDNNNTTDGPSQHVINEALHMTHQSIVLVKNIDKTLPLTHSNNNSNLKVLVTGPTSHSLSYQTGGWTGEWQGVRRPNEQLWFTYGSTVYDAAQDVENWDVTFECGVSIDGGDCTDDYLDLEEQANTDSSNNRGGHKKGMSKWVTWGSGNDDDSYKYSWDRAFSKAGEMDLVFVCIGEENYAEKPGDIRSLNLPDGQNKLVEGLKQALSSDSKLVVIYFGGRPRLLSEIVEYADAVLIGFLPGPLAGQAIVDLVTGKSNPSAKLPVTYPKYEDGGGTPYLHAISDMCTKDSENPLPHFEYASCEVQWPFGHGLSYTSFEYSNVQVSTTKLVYDHNRSTSTKRIPYPYAHQEDEDDEALSVSVTVANTGTVAGAETVFAFSFDQIRQTTPEYKRLRGFEKVWLEPGKSTTVQISIPWSDLKFVGAHDDTHYIIQDGMKFQIGIGADTDCRLLDISKNRNWCSPTITISTDKFYVGACEAACNLWSDSGCSEFYDLTSDKCWQLCTAIHEEDDLQLENDGWGWNYVECLESVVWGNSNEFQGNPKESCWKMTRFCRDVLATPNMDAFANGPSIYPPPPSSAYLPGGDGFSKNATLVSASACGLVSALAIIYAMRGGFSTFFTSGTSEAAPDGDVQFSVVPDREIA